MEQTVLTRASPLSPDDRICSPPFMELTSLCGDDTMRLLEENGLAFPFSEHLNSWGWGEASAAWGGHSPGAWVVRAWPDGDHLAPLRADAGPGGVSLSPHLPTSPLPTPGAAGGFESFSPYLPGWAL